VEFALDCLKNKLGGQSGGEWTVDLTSALRGDAFRPFATIVAPGALGVAPFAVLLYAHNPPAGAFWDTHPIATGIGLFIGSLAAGLVFEDLGARVEGGIDWVLDKRDPHHLPTWKQYLLLVLSPEPIGQRYLRTLVFRLKFELAVLGSLPAQLVGWLLVLRAQDAPGSAVRACVIAGIVVGVWFLFEAYDSAKTLGDLRGDLAARFGDTAAQHAAAAAKRD